MKTYAFRIRIFSLLSILLASCATTPPASFYTLAPLPAAVSGGTAVTRQSPAIGVGPVSFPAFLDRSQLVARSGASELSVDELHRWGGSLQDDFSRVLSENLAHLLGTSRVLLSSADVRYPVDFRVAVDVLRFESTPQGDAVLKARWALLNPHNEQALLVREGVYRTKAASADPAAAVDAMSRALGDFSRELADAIRGRPIPRPPVVDLGDV